MNRLTYFNGSTITHDPNGNMASFADGCGTTTYAWDSNSRLVSISGHSPDCTALAASYTYDALGRRIAKTINGETTKYLYDGADIVLEMNELNVATAYYIHGPGVDEPLARIELNADGTVKSIRFYIADALGSIIALTDENGTVKTQYNYTPFGEPETIGEESDNPFMFTGREYDPETELYYYRNRTYSWRLGRFISEDPIGLAGGINMYAYVGNNPVNFTDPFGLGGASGSWEESCGPNWTKVGTGIGLQFVAYGQWVITYIAINAAQPEAIPALEEAFAVIGHTLEGYATGSMIGTVGVGSWLQGTKLIYEGFKECGCEGK